MSAIALQCAGSSPVRARSSRSPPCEHRYGARHLRHGEEGYSQGLQLRRSIAIGKHTGLRVILEKYLENGERACGHTQKPVRIGGRQWCRSGWLWQHARPVWAGSSLQQIVKCDRRGVAAALAGVGVAVNLLLSGFNCARARVTWRPRISYAGTYSRRVGGRQQQCKRRRRCSWRHELLSAQAPCLRWPSSHR